MKLRMLTLILLLRFKTTKLNKFACRLMKNTWNTLTT